MSKSEKAAAALQVSGLGAVLRRLGAWRGVLVLNYHRIGQRPPWPSDRGIWSATADELDTQMRFLARHFQLLSAGDLIDRRARRNGRFVVVTFDDGYRETYEVAYPILDAHGVPATFFLTTGFVDATHTPWWEELAWMVRNCSRNEVQVDGWFAAPLSLEAADRQATTTLLIDRYKALSSEQAESFLDDVARATGSERRDPGDAAGEFVTWDMARELHGAGMAIGGHTVSHPILARLPRAEQQREIKGCLDKLEQELRARPKLFSYPVGLPDSFDGITRSCLRDNGVELAFSNYGGVIRGSTWDPHDVPRTSIASVSVSPRRFRALATLPSIFIDVERERLLSGLGGGRR